MKNINVRHNRAYRENENRIRSALYKACSRRDERVTVRKVAREAGLTRQTFYNHYFGVRQAVVTIEADMLKAFKSELRLQNDRLSKMVSNTNTRIFYIMFIFMDRHKNVFRAICTELDDHGLIFKMLQTVYPLLEINWLPGGAPAPDPRGERVGLYLWTLEMVIFWWGVETGCNMRKSDRYIGFMHRITEVAERNKIP